MFWSLIVFRSLVVCALFLNASSYAPIQPWIINGKDAVDPVPYQISLQKSASPEKQSHICGGSIISAQYILTAAHCLKHPLESTNYSVLAGTLDLKIGGSVHNVMSYKIHPNYIFTQPNAPVNDIAVVKVSPSFKFNTKTIQKIDYENSNIVPGKTPTVFTGWGLTEFGKTNILQIANFTTLSNEKCRKDSYPHLESSKICAVGNQNSHAYYGDSGGPLVNKDQNMLIGILSYGKKKRPQVFTRVSSFVNWIKGEIEIM